MSKQEKERRKHRANQQARMSECCPTSQAVQPDCSNAGCGMDRRRFLKIAGAGAASLAFVSPGVSPCAGVAESAAAPKPHLVPADKKLDPQWIRSLYEKGAPAVFRGKALDTIGMPVGGIGAGQLYLRGDGTLGCWQIFNKRHFSGYGSASYNYRTPDSPVDQGFAVVVETGGKTLARRMSRDGFANVEFVGEYPIGRVRFAQEGFPVKVQLEAFSPFIPLNARDSTLPATLFEITVENVSNESVKVQLLGWLENAVCFHSAADVEGLRRSRIVREKRRTLIVHSAEKGPEEKERRIRPPVVLADFEGDSYGDWKATGDAFGPKPASGAFPGQQKVSGFIGKGLVNTYFGSDKLQGTLTSPPFAVSRRYINFLIGGGGHDGQTCVNLLVGGKVARAAVGKNEEQLRWRSWNVREFEGQQAQIEIVDRHTGGWGHVNVDQIELSDERREGTLGPFESLEDNGTMALAFAGRTASSRAAGPLLADAKSLALRANVEKEVSFPISDKRATAILTSASRVKPASKRTFTFALAWHFPNASKSNDYADRFRNASEVAHYVLDNRDRLAGDTRKWHDAYYDSTLPHWLLDRLHWPVSNLATGTCLYWKGDRFWAWEGVGCCEGTCTHVWNYAHAMARLFPHLERTVREKQDLGDAFHPDGLVGFRGERNGQHAADGQAGTILKCYREHLMSADDSFLKRLWPRIKTALEYSMKQDGNDDGLIENSQHNTYDINFEGPNTFVGALYLAALRAGEEMAGEVGDLEFAQRARRVYQSGSRLTEAALWNGEYYIQKVDLAKYPKHQYGQGCLSDQLFGQGWAHHVALGYLLPREHVRAALESVWKYNWAPDIGPYNAAFKPDRWFISPGEAGLFTCTWPRSEYLAQGVLYRSEVWTGIEYQVAGHMIWEGMLDEAMVIVRAVHDRYHPIKHNPYNEVECGDHYARALASWGVLAALCGCKYHGPKGHIAFAPKLQPEDFRAVFTAAEGWGTFAQKREGTTQREQIHVRWGRLRVKTLAFAAPDAVTAPKVSVTVAGKKVEASHALENGRLLISLVKPTIVSEGKTLEVKITT